MRPGGQEGPASGSDRAAEAAAGQLGHELGPVQADRVESVAVPVGVDLVGQSALRLVGGVVVALGAQHAHQLLLVELHRSSVRRAPVVASVVGVTGGRKRGPAEPPGRTAGQARPARRTRKPPTAARTTASRSCPTAIPARSLANHVTDETRSTRATPRTSNPTRRSRRASREPEGTGPGADMRPTLPAGQSRRTIRISSRSSPRATPMAPGTRPTSV